MTVTLESNERPAQPPDKPLLAQRETTRNSTVRTLVTVLLALLGATGVIVMIVAWEILASLS